MYKIFIDGGLAYDSTLEDFKIGKGEIVKELDKSGSFVFSLYPDHPYYDRFVLLRTEVVVYKDERIAFRGRVIDEVTDFWNNKVLTCEGELGFLQDSIVRPYNYTGEPAALFRQFVGGHNAQVDEFKRFKVGTCTVVDPNGYIARENTNYESTLANMTSRLLEDATGGHFYITHGADGTDPVPTLHWVADFTRVASQPIEFGENLRSFTKTVKAEEVATAIIPLGATVDDKNSDTEDPKLTIASVNGGVDYVYSPKGVALYGWIFRVVAWDDVTKPAILKAKAREYVDKSIEEALTLELSAVDLHLLDRNIESYELCDYIPVSSAPHSFEAVLLCNKQTLNLLKPDSDSVVLGRSLTRFTNQAARNAASVARIQSISGQLSQALVTAKKTNAELVEVASKLDALYATGYVSLVVTVTDSEDEAGLLLTTYGSLTVAGQRISSTSARAATTAGSDVVVTYTPLTDLSAPRTVTANGTALGVVSASGETVTATLKDVADGSTIVIEFKVESTETE